MEPEDFLEGIQSCFDEDSSFDFARWGSHGIEQVAPLWMLKCLANMPTCHIAIYHDFRGPNNTITQRETSANLAVTEACNLILDDEADAAVAGGTGTMMLPLSMLHAMVETDVAPGGQDPSTICRPFDRDRSGSVVGEGAAVIVLEELAAATARGAPIYGEIKGCGSSCVADREHGPRVDVALINAMHAALRKAQMSPDQIGHLNAHGLSARQSDIDEARAIREVFGEGADHLPVVAVKSYVGNSGAGCGAIELVASLLAMDRGRLFPVLNYENPDPACPVSAVTSSDVEARQSFINLSTVSQGQASCLLVGALN
jgi:3-oxoacyl-[acyl-carrier-protein] synthase II